jgi:hypothetical protein
MGKQIGTSLGLVCTIQDRLGGPGTHQPQLQPDHTSADRALTQQEIIAQEELLPRQRLGDIDQLNTQRLWLAETRSAQTGSGNWILGPRWQAATNIFYQTNF